MTEEEKEKRRRQQAVLDVMKIKIKDSPYKANSENQLRKRRMVESEIKKLES